MARVTGGQNSDQAVNKEVLSVEVLSAGQGLDMTRIIRTTLNVDDGPGGHWIIDSSCVGWALPTCWVGRLRWVGEAHPDMERPLSTGFVQLFFFICLSRATVGAGGFDDESV